MKPIHLAMWGVFTLLIGTNLIADGYRSAGLAVELVAAVMVVGAGMFATADLFRRHW